MALLFSFFFFPSEKVPQSAFVRSIPLGFICAVFLLAISIAVLVNPKKSVAITATIIPSLPDRVHSRFAALHKFLSAFISFVDLIAVFPFPPRSFRLCFTFVLLPRAFCQRV